MISRIPIYISLCLAITQSNAQIHTSFYNDNDSSYTVIYKTNNGLQCKTIEPHTKLVVQERFNQDILSLLGKQIACILHPDFNLLSFIAKHYPH